MASPKQDQQTQQNKALACYNYHYPSMWEVNQSVNAGDDSSMWAPISQDSKNNIHLETNESDI